MLFICRHNLLCFHVTSRQPCWCPQLILRELNFILMRNFSFGFGRKTCSVITWVKTLYCIVVSLNGTVHNEEPKPEAYAALGQSTAITRDALLITIITMWSNIWNISYVELRIVKSSKLVVKKERVNQGKRTLWSGRNLNHDFTRQKIRGGRWRGRRNHAPPPLSDDKKKPIWRFQSSKSLQL